MAQTSYPFEGIDTTETQFSQFFRNFGAGVQGSPTGTELKVTAGVGLNFNVGVGQAMVRGHYYISTAVEASAVATANPTNPRIDTVVLRLDPDANSILIAVVAGTPAASPVAPTLTQTDAGIYEFPLANILVPAAGTSISTITDTRTFLGARFGVWSTATRPSFPVTGFSAGYNTTLAYPEYWNGSAWVGFTADLSSFVTLTGAQTVTNKTLTSPVINNAALGGQTLERFYTTATGFAGYTFYHTTNSAYQYSTGNATANGTINFTATAGTTLNSLMAVGDSATCVLIITNGATAYRPTAFTIDGNAVTVKWLNGTMPATGNASSLDVYSFSILKTASATYTVLASQSRFA